MGHLVSPAAIAVKSSPLAHINWAVSLHHNYSAMLQPHLIHAILNEPWAIHEDSIPAYSHLVDSLFNKNIAFEKGEPVLPSVHAGAVIIAGGDQPNGKALAQKNIQVISMRGPLTKYSQFCGPSGMLDMAAWVEQADKDPNFDAIVLRIDSPGGMVAGTETLAAAIRNASKPVIAFVDDLAASAAYWIASEADEIIANNTTAQLGSIGVLLSFMDVQPYFEKQGVKFHTISAPQSENKTKLFDKIRSGDYVEYKEKVLRPLAQKFIDAVKGNRPAATDDQFKADVWFASELVGTLVDSIGSFQHALNRAATLAHEQTQASSKNPDISMKKHDYNRLAKAAGVPQLESADGSITLTGEMAEAVEAALQSHEDTAANLQQQIDNATNQQARVTELEGQLQTANNRIAELEKGAGAESAAITKETDGEAGASSAVDDFWARFHALDKEFSKS